MITDVTSATVIREARLRAGLTQEELARRLGRPKSNVSRWERGAVTPSLETLTAVVAACGLQLTFGLRPADDSFDAFIRDALALSPAERLAAALTRADAYEEMREVAARHEELPV